MTSNISNNNNDIQALANMSISELAECNIISQRFTGKQYDKPVENRRIKEDIQIQKDILDFLDNGGHIITRISRKKIKPLSVFSRTVSL